MANIFSDQPDRTVKGSGKFRGRASADFGYLRILQDTRPSEAPYYWWELRAYLIATDHDQQARDLPLLAGLLLRFN